MKKLAFVLLNIVALGAFAQTVAPFKSPRQTFTDPNGVPLAGGCIFSYAGGTSTPQATYTSSTGITQNPDPIILDSTGSAIIWLGPNNYKFVAFSAGGTNCASGAQQWSVDQVPGNTFYSSVLVSPTITGGTISGSAITGTITGSTIQTSTVDSTPVGQTTASSGRFTTVAGAVDTLAFSATPVFPAGSYSYFLLQLTNNVTSSTITGATAGQDITLNICQDGTGARTFAWPTNVVNPPPLNPTANGCTLAQMFFAGAGWYYYGSQSSLAQYGPVIVAGNFDAMTFSPTPVFAAQSYTHFAMTLTGNVTSSTITGGYYSGQVITLDLCENSVGGFTFAWPTTGTLFFNQPSIDTAANACTGVIAVFNSALGWEVVGVNAPSAALVGNLDALAFSATPVFAAASYTSFTLTLTGNVTSSTITGGSLGQLLFLDVCQDATGSRTIVWPTNLLNAPTMPSTANACLGITSIYDGTNWRITGASIVSGSAGLIQSASSGTGCTTGASSYSVCTMSVAWPTAFADTGYQVACNAIGPADGGNPTSGRATENGVTSKTTTGVTYQVATSGANSITYTGLDCIARHP